MTININGKLLDLSSPRVMGIVNLTPDSFYAESRAGGCDDVVQRVRGMLRDGADIIDVGAYSSRPGADDVSTEEEMRRLRRGLEAITREVPDAVISVDTFRADVAKMCVEEYGAAIVNDISGGQLDPMMHRTVAALHVPYILMHMQGSPQTMQAQPHYDDLLEELILYFSERINALHDMGVSDIIVDPGFGFGKTLDHNYQLLARMDELQELQCPVLVGVSRKSMIYQLLGTSPQDALNGTTALNMLALMHGADILRVHDVKPCVETIKIYNKYKENDNDRY